MMKTIALAAILILSGFVQGASAKEGTGRGGGFSTMAELRLLYVDQTDCQIIAMLKRAELANETVPMVDWNDLEMINLLEACDSELAQERE